ncbi:very-long-chain (3R)-3-hydroxyacyl-CoA dehydratase 4 [Pteropus vampyrus]|uniref:Very-long-chain (3R)-3-hydroxyacyl-CoA dehydratase n=1 Tax=Pteropus vampyrus TaxID=132908 RepID=A0A6P3QEJ2_PTEVA|nr:very-long-chain (3R)-3-hydroxyacyl-CoA dehydratase 4 [Pteropus vampyrus]
MGLMAQPAWLQPRYRKNTYLFLYYLIQFCGHSWIFTNMTARFFSFGKDSMADTFYAIGLVMRLCQSISLLELLHIRVGIESSHLLPRFLQLTERIIILFVVITSQEEIQEKYVVCVLFIFWNLLDMVRFSAIPIGIQAGFAEIEKLIQKLIWKLKEPTTAKTILKKRNIVGRLILSNYKTYYKAIIIKGVIPA